MVCVVGSLHGVRNTWGTDMWKSFIATALEGPLEAMSCVTKGLLVVFGAARCTTRALRASCRHFPSPPHSSTEGKPQPQSLL